jgi:hypothetical protein
LNNIGTDATLQSYYSVHWRLLSFQSTDLLLPPLAKMVGLFLAARIFVAVTFLALVGGVAALHRALFGWVGLWPAASALLLYNHLLAWGFVSYLFALGLALLMIAAWIATRGWPSPPRLLVFSLATLVLFLCHFFAFAAYAVVIATYEFSRLLGDGTLRNRHRIAALAGAALPFFVPMGLALYGHDNLPATYTFYGDAGDKLRAILSPIIMYLALPDTVVAVAFIAIFALFVRLRHFEWLRVMILPLAVILALAFIMPTRLFDVWGVDLRLPTFLLFLFIGSTTLKLSRRPYAIGFAVFLVALMVLRVGVTYEYWTGYQSDIRELRAALGKIEKGSRVVSIISVRDHRARPAPNLSPYTQFFSFAVIDRDALLPRQFTSATPLDFANRGRGALSGALAKTRPIQWRPTRPEFMGVSPSTVAQAEALARKAVEFDYYSSSFDWSAWPEHYDYVIDLNFGRADNPVPALLTEIWRGSYFSIFRIHPPSPG